MNRNNRDTGTPCHNVARLYKLSTGMLNTSTSTAVKKIPMYMILDIRF